uniref:Uncharacterized protein n=1 Tax=Halimeda minima TaxID=170427 RepID=A0A386AYX3_9CHLO|nr:hypothetical protein [Halimeda minima]
MASNELMWTLVEGNILTVELNYLVFNRSHKVQFFFVVKTGGPLKASPLTITAFFRNLSKIFIPEVCSQELIWESTKLTHLEGSLKLSEDAQTNTELEKPEPLAEAASLEVDMENRLRVSFVRYNQNAPIFFYLYRENLETKKLASALLQMTQEDLNIEGSDGPVGLRFAGLTNSSQVTENQFVVSISCKKQPIPKKQVYNKEEL